MKLFVIFVTIFIVGICAESNIDLSSDHDESGESVLNILAKLTWSKACVHVNGKWKCQESTNIGNGQPTKTRTYSGSGHSNGSPFKDLFGDSPFDMVGERSSLFGNSEKRSSRTSNAQSSQNSQSGQNAQKTQSTPIPSQGSETAKNSRSKFKIVKPSPQIASEDDDILI